MPFIGILGTPDSTLGNILLGSTTSIGGVQASLTGSSSISANLTHTTSFNVVLASYIVSNGTVLVSFNQALTIDSVLLNPATFSITGPSVVSVSHVYMVNAQTVALITSGIITGSYLVTVSTSVQDIALEPLVDNVAAFSAQIPYTVRSIYTHHGPIVKPPLTIQQGHQWSVQTEVSNFSGVVYRTTLNGAILATDTRLVVSSLSGFYGNPASYSLKVDDEYLTITLAASTQFTVIRGRKSSAAVAHADLAPVELLGAVTLNKVTLPGGAFNSSHVGLYLRLGGSTVNGGSYKILKVIDATHLQVQASFRAPSSDPNNNSALNTWTLYDPRTGFIADSPSDVVVRINGSPVTVDVVIGLLGQIVLTTPPIHGDTIVVDYEWMYDPTVEVRRLNSREFRSNNGNNIASLTGMPYLYRNVLQTSSGANNRISNDDIRAPLSQPLLRDVFYRAYERAYTASLNDPTLLRLNTPKNRTAYPPLARKLSEVSVTYDGDVLPESDLIAPWVRNGSGSASIVSGNLLVIDNTSGPYPVGQPFYWTREVDLSFKNVYAATWRMKIDSTVPDGVFTGISTGWSDNYRTVILGYLLDSGVRKIGFLKRGFGNTLSLIGSWTGGLDLNGNPTGLPVGFDWSIYHSYRFLKDINGTINLFVDGEAVESLQITEDQLPLLEELDATFNQVQNIFFGSLSREATNQSTWQFVRYLILPTDATQSAPFVDVSYGQPPPLTVLPEDFSKPWTPIGYHGNENLVTIGPNVDLILDSTSYTSSQPSLIGGDFRGFTRIEPLLSVSSSVVVDFDVSLRTYTHGITPNAVMVAVDDGKFLVQVCFFPTQSQPKVSYPGRSMPQDATPEAWASLGGAPAHMIGRTLRIEDSSVSNGRLFSINDLAVSTSPNRIFETSIDYLFEFQCAVISFVQDGTPEHFCGVTTDVFDGTYTIGVMLNEDGSGNPLVSFHSDGVIVASFSFNWNNGDPHTYRVTKNTAGNLVVLFIDNIHIGSTPYTNFSFAGGTPTLSFGSTTQTSVFQSKSVVDWYYVNGWRGQPLTATPPDYLPRHYVGIWKGSDSNTLLGYYLPTKVSGRATTINNIITDLTADFISDLVQPGNDFIIDDGDNRGVYQVVPPITSTTLYLSTNLPQPGATVVRYRIPKETDWTTDHTYQILRDPTGFVGLFQDASSIPLIQVDYNHVTLPPSSVGLPSIINRDLPSVSWGAFDSTNLSQTAWRFVHYAITTSPIEVKIIPPHQVSNQRNVMASPEHLFGVLPHAHTQYSSASTGVPYQWEAYVNDPSVQAYTRLNEGTPPVPLSQTFKKSRTVTISVPPTGFGGSSLGTDLFGSGNLPATTITIPASTGALYNNIEILEKTSGEVDLVSAFSDEVSITMDPNPVSIEANLTGESWISV
jgi:hypothetical protein